MDTEDDKIAQAYASYSDIFKQTYECARKTDNPVYNMYHMNPVMPSKSSGTHDLISFNHFDILKHILTETSDYEPKSMKIADDRQIWKMMYHETPVILKKQEASTGNTNLDLKIKKSMYSYYMNKNSDPQYIDKIYSLLDRTDIESLTEVYNGTVMNNMNSICPIFPYLYHAAFDFVLDMDQKTITPYVVQIQEFLGESLQDLIDSLNDDPLDNDQLKVANYKQKCNIYETMIMQIMFSFLTAQRIMDFVHFDLRLPNITFERTDQKYINYNLDGVLYTVPTYGILFHVIDFGRSYVDTGKLKTGTDMYVTDYETNDRSIDGKKLDYADILLFTREFLYRGDVLFIDESRQFSSKNGVFYKIMKDALKCDGDYEKIYPKFLNCDSKFSSILEKDGFEKPFNHFYSCVMDPVKYDKLKQLRTKKLSKNNTKTLSNKSLDYDSQTSGSFAAFHPFELSKNCSEHTSITKMIGKYGVYYLVPDNEYEYVMNEEEILIV